MVRKRTGWWPPGRRLWWAAALLVVVVHGAGAQGGTLQGGVRDSVTGAPLAGVEVVLAGGSVTRRAVTDDDGRFSFRLPAPATYTVSLSRVGYAARRVTVVVADTRITLDVPMVALGIPLDPVVVSASRTAEAALQAPAAVSVLGREALEQGVGFTPIEQARDVPGVDFASKGLIQHTFSFRGTNTVNSGDVLMLHDYRYAAIPAVNLNVPYLIPTSPEDLDRIEVMRGPSAALYGPGAPRGVLHVLTRSPFQSQGMTVSVTGGSRHVAAGDVRLASRVSDAVAYKVSADYFRGNDWESTDPVERANRAAALAAMADPDTLLIGRREFSVERFGAEGRVDWRPGAATEVVTAVGVAQAVRALDLAPAVGAIQGRNWRYTFAQLRVRHGRLFGNLFYNWSDAGDTYLLRSGDRLVDDSRVLVGQVQHGVVAGPVDLLYGADLRWTNPRTGGTIHGANEEDDLVAEVGGYLHAAARLGLRWTTVAALRVDHHNRLNGLVLSPRVGIVFTPAATHAIRATYNRAFTSPDANDLFLDIVADRITLPAGFGYDIRAVGVPKDGFTFARECNGLCMRSPFNLGSPQAYLPADATVLWPALVLFGQQLGIDLSSIPQPSAADVGSRIAVLDLSRGFVPVDAADISDIAGEGRTITNTLEAGYRGLWGGRVAVTVDAWVNRVSDLAGAVVAGTPNVFFDGESLERYLAGFLPADLAAQIADTVAQVPLGTISPRETPHPVDILLVNRRGGVYWLWGADLGVEAMVLPGLSLSGSVSWVSEDTIPDVEAVGTVFLNIPRTKGSLGLAFQDGARGWDVAVRGRWVSSFRVVSGLLGGSVGAYQVVDASVGYRPRWWRAAHVTVSLRNALDARHREFVASPRLGRQLLTRLRLAF